MKERPYKGIGGHLLSAIFFILIFIAVLWYSLPLLFSFGSFNRYVDLSNAMYKYRSSGFPAYDGDHWCIPVYGIYDTEYVMNDDSEVIYLLDVGDAFYYMKAKYDDKVIAGLLEAGDSLLENPQAIMVEAYADSIMDELTEELFPDEEDTEIVEYIVNGIYIEPRSMIFEQVVFWGLNILAFCFAFAGVFSVFNRIKKNRRNYEKLYDIDPSLRNDLASLKDHAEYIDEKLKIYVYKAHLIIDYKGFDIYNLDSIRWIYHEIRIRRVYFIPVYKKYSLNIFYEESGKHKRNDVLIRHWGKKTEQIVFELYKFIIDRYPHIIIGYDKEARQAYQELKKGKVG